jgi:hypothetical protein
MNDVYTILGGLVVWSTTLVAAVMWLNTKFSSLVPAIQYEVKHKEIESRLRILELWAATKSFYATSEREIKASA